MDSVIISVSDFLYPCLEVQQVALVVMTVHAAVIAHVYLDDQGFAAVADHYFVDCSAADVMVSPLPVDHCVAVAMAVLYLVEYYPADVMAVVQDDLQVDVAMDVLLLADHYVADAMAVL